MLPLVKNQDSMNVISTKDVELFEGRIGILGELSEVMNAHVYQK